MLRKIVKLLVLTKKLSLQSHRPNNNVFVGMAKTEIGGRGSEKFGQKLKF